MRTSGQGLGPGFTIVATRRSVIFSLDGRELVLTPIGYASIAFAPKRVPKAAADVFKTSRRCMSSCPFPRAMQFAVHLKSTRKQVLRRTEYRDYQWWSALCCRTIWYPKSYSDFRNSDG